MRDDLLAPPARSSISGGTSLSGSVAVAGFKHSLVTILAATTAVGVPVRLTSCPDIVETAVLADLLAGVGARVERRGDALEVDPRGIRSGDLDPDLVARVHGAPYLAPGLLARTGSARVPAAGGCRIGAGPEGRRPSAHYAAVLSRFGADVAPSADGALVCRADRLRACTIDLREFTRGDGSRENLYSGATKMALLAAATAEGTTFLLHPYDRSDVVDLLDALDATGAEVERRPASIAVTAPSAPRRQPVAMELRPDLIEVVTWVTIGALLADEGLWIAGAQMSRAVQGLTAEIEIWEAMGVPLRVAPDGISVERARALRSTSIIVDHHSGIYSDSHPFFALLGTAASGRTTIVERVWPDRFGYIPGLQGLGFAVERDGPSVVIDGPTRGPRSTDAIVGEDLRSAAVLLIAALATPGSTSVSGLAHLGRGYAGLVPSLVSLGAQISIGST